MMDVTADPNQAAGGSSGWLRTDPSAMGGGALGGADDMGAGGGGDMWLHGSMAESNNAYYNRTAMHHAGYRTSPGKCNINSSQVLVTTIDAPGQF